MSMSVRGDVCVVLDICVSVSIKKIIFCIVIVYNIYMSGYVPVYYTYSMIMQRNNSVLSYV